MQVCSDLGTTVDLHTLLPEAKFTGTGNLRIDGCACDSRQVLPGQLFVAISGTRHDGHDHVTEAIRRGCVAVLSQRALPEVTVPVGTVADARAAYGQICQALAANPSHDMKVIGVTGTNGKTTTACLIAGILTEADHKVGMLGTLGYLDGKETHESTLTTPPADELATWLRRMARNDCSHVVMEVSSHALDQARVAGVRFDAACVTNVTQDHLDYHPTIRDYRAAKSKLFSYLPPEGFAVINADDPIAVGYLRQIDSPVLTVGIHAPAEISATIIEQSTSEQIFLLRAGSETIPVRTCMIGDHHVYNCLVAAAVGLTYGIELPTIAKGIESIGHVPGRLERIECGQPFGVFVDYAHTPDALTAALRALRDVIRGRLICVFGAGGNRDREKRPMMASAVEAIADLAILTSDNPRDEDPREITHDVLSGFRRRDQVEVVLDRTEAIAEALSIAEPGDCVLIAGKGHENYQIVGGDRIPLDDGDIAKGWLYEFQPHAADVNQ